ncbi:MAG: hypothetical protein WCO11_05000 [Sphingomonadales bacterium]|jgi:hypothetical protein
MNAYRITDRFTILGLAVAAALPFLAISPVKAAPAACAVEAQAVLTDAAASNASGDNITRAVRLAKVAAKMCEEGNRFEAAKKFAQARSQLGTDVQMAERR